jgi:hypothetical protein
MAFPDANGDSGWYLVTGFIWLIIGNWLAIKTLTSK